MAVIPKKKKSKRSSYKNGQYADSIPGNGDYGRSEIYFDPSHKVSKYTNQEKVGKGYNPVFTHPIPNMDPMKTPMLNDEVDMYFPRKHFHARYTMYNDMVDNIILKQIPLHKIIPPRIFPIAFVEGEPLEKKKASIITEMESKKVDVVNQGEKSANVETEEKVKEETKPVQSATETQSAQNEEKKAFGEPAEKQSTDGTTTKSTDKLGNADDNLSDYDPDFPETETPATQYTEQQEERINDYLSNRLSSKDPTDFFFGDLKAMKLQEAALKKHVTNLETELKDMGNHISGRHLFNIAKLNELHESISTFTAGTIQTMDAKLEAVETELKNDYHKKMVDVTPVKKFSTTAFDTYKVGLSPSEYIAKFKQKPPAPPPMPLEQEQHQQQQQQLQHQEQQQHVLGQNLQQQQSTTLMMDPDAEQQYTQKPEMQQQKQVVPQVASNNISAEEGKSSTALSQNFDFEGNMLYGNGEFGGDDAGMVDDEDFGSLSNEVFF
jgi:hypothetical protein